MQVMDAIKGLWPRRGSFGARVLTLMSGTAAGQGLTLAAAPLLTRLYAPEDFGLLAVFLSLLAVLGVVGSGRYEWAIPLPESEATAADLTVLCGAILLVLTAVTGVGMLLLGDRMLAWTNALRLRPYLWLVPVGLLGVGMYQILTQWALRRQAFGALARTKVTQSLGRAATAVALGLAQVTPLGLLVGEVVGRAGGCGTLGALAWQRDGAAWRQATWGRICRAAQRYRRFPLFSGPSTMLNTLTPQVPIMMLSANYGPQVVGWYSLGLMVVAAPLAVVIMSGSQVFRAEAARLAQGEAAALPGLFFGTVKRLLWGVIPVGLLAWAAPCFMPLVFGSQWAEAGQCTRALTLMFAAQFVVNPVSHLDLYELQHWDLAWDLGRLVMMTGTLYVCQRYGVSALHAMGAYSVAMTLFYLIIFVLNIMAIKRVVAAAEKK